MIAAKLNVTEKLQQLDWEKVQNLMPAVVQDVQTAQVLMLGYMNPAALQQTISSGQVTFYSRSKQRLWTKGETSGNYLKLINIIPDCDNDSLLVLVEPKGSTCHEGNVSCFNEQEYAAIVFLGSLERLITERQTQLPDNSYTTELFKSGIQRIAQKVGEEAVEMILAAVSNDRANTISEAADLLYHFIVLLRAKNISLAEICQHLAARS